MPLLRYCTAVLLIASIWCVVVPQSYAAAGKMAEQAAYHGTMHGQDEGFHWEGSMEGKTYSERNHWLAGIFLLLIGYGEWRTAGGKTAGWAQMLVPAALFACGVFLLIWSDHEAWPIGRMSFIETLSGGDPEILQHKIIGLMSILVGAIEAGRRSGRLLNLRWEYVLPVYASVGGLLLLVHEHGPHPSGHQIDQHHTLMAGLAIAAAVAKGLTLWSASSSRGDMAAPRTGPQIRLVGGRIWASFIIILGLSLLLYRE